MPPLQVADVVFEAIKKEQFYILPHPEWTEVIQLRMDKLLRMENRKALQQRLRNSLTCPGERRNVRLIDPQRGIPK